MAEKHRLSSLSPSTIPPARIRKTQDEIDTEDEEIPEPAVNENVPLDPPKKTNKRTLAPSPVLDEEPFNPKDFLNSTFSNITIAQLLQASPSLQAELSSLITKRRKNVGNSLREETLSVESSSTGLRTDVKVEGVCAETIIDGGSTNNCGKFGIGKAM